MSKHLLLATVLVMVTLTVDASADENQPVTWRISQIADAWHLWKDDEPFFIQGAVGWQHFDVLRSCGGNAVRVPAKKRLLDAAFEQGLFAMANLPVRGERSGLDWANAQQVAEQKQRVLDCVAEFKDHPAIMFWSIGNELDHIPGPRVHNPKLWERLNDLAVAIKQIDPAHPVLTVVGTGRFEQKIQEISRVCRDMDLLGINCYGDIDSVMDLARRHWPGPFVITEWGPTGHWQVPKTEWKAPLEQTSSQKARVIRQRYENSILADPAHCLGSFVFYWSEKQETTHTWYGLFRDGLRTESIDVMQQLWTGQWPENRAPTIQQMTIDGCVDPKSIYLAAGTTYRATVTADDPDADSLRFAWDLRPEVQVPAGSYAGSGEARARPIEGLISNSASQQIEFTAPRTPGPYRLFVTILDGHSHAGYGNLPFFVRQD